MKFSKYNYVVEMDYGILLYNSFHESYVQIYNKADLNKFKELLSSNTFDPNDNMVKALYNRGFIVDDDINEYEKVKEEIENYYDNDKELYIMLYVTENCNFRCIYCIEKHLDRKFSKKNWNNLYNYIETCIVNDTYNKVTINFFGGEPLLEKNSIIEFLDRLLVLNKKYPNVKFSHQMTTNGYLLTPNVYNELTKRNLGWYNITLDGFAQNHDKTRPLAGGGGTWDKIVKNLEYINNQEDEVRVTLRSNLCKTSNVKEFDEYSNWFKTTFDNKRISLSLSKIGKYSDNVSDDLVVEPEDSEIIDFVNDNSPSYTDLIRLGGACKFVRKGFFTISVDGKIRKCEDAYNNDYDSMCVGSLSDNGITFNTDMSEWETGFEFELCENCKAYPTCGARTCPDVYKYYTKERINCLNYDSKKGCFVEGLADKKITSVLKNIFPKLKVKKQPVNR